MRNLRTDLSWILIIGLFLFIGCKSQSKKTKTETKTEIEKQEQKTEKQEVSGSLDSHFESSHLENEVLNYDFSLESKDANSPAKITEYRNGKPYRTLIAENANYSENKKRNKKKEQEVTKDYSADFSALKTAFEHQKTTIVQLQKKIEILKVDNFKIANNIKYLLWLLLAFAGIWIAERSGLFRLLKKFLNGL